jgi:hypothetical protein
MCLGKPGSWIEGLLGLKMYVRMARYSRRLSPKSWESEIGGWVIFGDRKES